MNSNLQSKSRKLSYLLRHNPEELSMDKNGYVLVLDILSKLDISLENLETIVEENDKKRFSFNKNRDSLRASQGHSVTVDLGLKSQVPPVVLYHGTVDSALKGIFKYGLKKVKRHAVHLSHETLTATKVGSRRGDAIILEIDSKRMYADGIKFFKSENGVWLVDEVPSKYIKKL